VIAALLLVGVLAQTPETPLQKLAHLTIAAHVVSEFADVATTEYALGTGKFHESNPILKWATQDPIPMAIIKGSFTAGTSLLLLKLHHSHPKLAILASSTSALLTGWVAHRNAQGIRSLR
jgi:hypothetical protein